MTLFEPVALLFKSIIDLVVSFLTLPVFYNWCFAELICFLILISFAWRSRSWLLLAGLAARLPLAIQHSVHLFGGLFGVAYELQPSSLLNVNQILYCISQILIPIALIFLLSKSAKNQNRLSSYGSFE